MIGVLTFVFAGRFGIGVEAYFVFLRYLVGLNLLHSAFVWGFILGPTIAYGNNTGESVRAMNQPTARGRLLNSFLLFS